MTDFPIQAKQLVKLMRGNGGRWPVPPLAAGSRVIIIPDSEPAQGWVTMEGEE